MGRRVRSPEDLIERTVLLSDEHREGVRVVTRKDGSTVPVPYVVTPTHVSNPPYLVAVWWTLGDDDPRSVGTAGPGRGSEAGSKSTAGRPTEEKKEPPSAEDGSSTPRAATP